jgi:hypothetical protein
VLGEKQNVVLHGLGRFDMPAKRLAHGSHASQVIRMKRRSGSKRRQADAIWYVGRKRVRQRKKRRRRGGKGEEEEAPYARERGARLSLGPLIDLEVGGRRGVAEAGCPPCAAREVKTKFPSDTLISAPDPWRMPDRKEEGMEG